MNSQEHFAHILGEADDGEDDIRPLGHCLRTFAPDCAGVEQRLGLVLAAVEDRRLVTFGYNMLTHPAAHDAGADPADTGLAWLCFGE